MKSIAYNQSLDVTSEGTKFLQRNEELCTHFLRVFISTFGNSEFRAGALIRQYTSMDIFYFIIGTSCKSTHLANHTSNLSEMHDFQSSQSETLFQNGTNSFIVGNHQIKRAHH